MNISVKIHFYRDDEIVFEHTVRCDCEQDIPEVLRSSALGYERALAEERRQLEQIKQNGIKALS